MAHATLLSMVQDVYARMGLAQPATLFGNTDLQVVQFLALAQEEGRFIGQLGAKAGGWQELGATATISLLNATSTYALAADYLYMKPQTIWDRSFRWQLLGPLSPQERDVILYGISPVGPRRRWWMENNLININPVPGPGDVGTILSYDYISTGWCNAASGGAKQVSWLADGDTYGLDDEAFRLGLKWRYKREKGFDYADDYEDWKGRVDAMLARSGGNRYLPINSTAGGIRLISDANVPDTGYGS